MALEVGATLGNYQIESQLSVGGMGEIYVAEDTQLHRKVALKVLPGDWTSDPERLERFQWEAQVLATLNHPNIVTIYSVEEHDGVHFFTMELVEGKTLAELIPGGLPLDRLLELAVPLADALAAAHQRGIIHRDLKPGNVMVNVENRLKILDFGLAKREHDTAVSTSASGARVEQPRTQEGHLMGTVAYMAPEQIYGMPIDHRADIYTLGIVLFEMATGERPFTGMDRVNPFSDTGSRARKMISPRLEGILRRCLQNDPKKRYQTSVELRDDLADLRLDYQSAVHSTQSRLLAMWRRERGVRWIAAAAAAVVVAALGVAVLWPRGAAVSDSGLENVHRLEEPKRIVVLPLENLGPPEDEYFAAGITEEITSRLSSVSALRVISRTTAMHYDRTGKTVGEIGGELGVDYVLEGTVRWSRASEGTNRVRVTPRLIRVADDTNLWSETYDRVLDDIFSVQSDIASAVIHQLDIALLEPERQVLAASRTTNMDAYEAYLRGMDYGSRREPGSENWQLAVQMFERAVKLDPHFAIAYAELSEVYSFVYFLRVDPREENVVKAKQAADRALEIDPDLPEGHRALGYYHYWCRRDFAAALKEFDIAAQRLPNDSQLIEGIAYIRRRQGRFDEALDGLRTAMELNPRSVWPAAELANTLTHLRRYEEADLIYERAITLAPDQPAPYQSRAQNFLLWKGETKEARETLEEMPRQEESSSQYSWFRIDILEGNYTGALERLRAIKGDLVGLPSVAVPKDLLRGFIFDLMGQSEVAQGAYDLARRRLEILLRDRGEDPRVRIALALAEAGLGHRDEAIQEGQSAVGAMAGDAYVGPAFREHLAEVYTQLGDNQAALDEIEQLLAIPSGLSLPMLELDPRWKTLRDEPRFQAWVRASRSGP